MKPPTPAARAVRAILAITALFLPTLSLVPLGGLYLWEKGWLLYWAVAAFGVVGAIILLQRAMMHVPASAAAAAAASGTPPEPSWSPQEDKAWEDVRAIATGVDLDILVDQDAIIDLGLRTAKAVATRLHPEKPDAVWRFTVPEVLAITERVSRRLSEFTVSHVPFGDRMTVAQVWTVYRWRHAIDVAERAYDVWRLLRLANPATAVTHEARDRLSRAVLKWGREHVMRRLAEAYVEEVGRAAIDLYGGRLKTAGQRGSPATASTVVAEPMRVLVAMGEPGDRAAIAAAIMAASSEVAPIDVGTLARGAKSGASDLAARAAEADVVVWLLDTLPPSSRDHESLSALSAHFQARPRQRPPVIVPVAAQPRPLPPEAGEATVREIGRALPGTIAPPIALGADASAAPVLAEIRARILSLAPEAARVAVSRRETGGQASSRWTSAAWAGRQAGTAIATAARSLWRRGRG